MSDRCTCQWLVQPGSEHLVSHCSSQAPRVCVCVCVGRQCVCAVGPKLSTQTLSILFSSVELEKENADLQSCLALEHTDAWLGRPNGVFSFGFTLLRLCKQSRCSLTLVHVLSTLVRTLLGFIEFNFTLQVKKMQFAQASRCTSQN